MQANPIISQTDWPYYKAEYDAHRMSQGAIAKQLGITQGAVSRRFKAMDKATVNGNLPAVPSAHSDAPERISALPAHYNASELDNLRGRVATLEAFMAAIESQQRPSAPERTESASAHQDALQRIMDALAQLNTRLHVVEASTLTPPPASALPAHSDAPAQRIAPERTEPPTWVNRGTHVAADMLEAIDAYAQRHRLEKREVLDRALRTFFALVAGEGASDA
jgi:AcrR family transcriptional regulator